MNRPDLKFLFFGIYQLGVSALEGLREAGYLPQAVVTKPAGPGQLQPVLNWAEEHRIPCWSPASPKDPAFIEAVKHFAPDLILVAGYHRIIPADILDIPPLGAFNLHASLLPRYRGPCPYKWALINGETITGLTVHQMLSKPDSGLIYSQVMVPIDDEDDAQSLFLKLCPEGAKLLCRTVEQILAGTSSPQPQDESLATYQGYPLDKDSRINWNRPAEEIRNLIRGLCPKPGAWTLLAGRKLRICKATISSRKFGGPAGRLVSLNGKYLVTTATGNLVLEQWSYDSSCPGINRWPRGKVGEAEEEFVAILGR